MEDTKDQVPSTGDQFETKDPLTSHPFGSSVVEVASTPGNLGSSGNPANVIAGEKDDNPGFWAMLEEAGISKKNIVIIIAVFVGIIAVVLFLLFWTFGGSSDGGTDKPVKTVVEDVGTGSVEVPAVDVKPSDTKNAEITVPPTFNQVFALSGLVNSYVFGLEFSSARGVLLGLNVTPVSYGGSTVGIDSSIAIGAPSGVNKEALVSYIDLLREIENARKVDIYEYLNKFVDRRQALQDHLAILNGLVLKVESYKSAVLQGITALDLQYKASSVEKTKYETGFFESMNSMYGETAYNNLELFVEASQKQIKEKAYYNSLVTVNKLFDSAISALAPRIQDISVNADALIKGVKVFEIHGSNIDAIIIQQNQLQ